MYVKQYTLIIVISTNTQKNSGEHINKTQSLLYVSQQTTESFIAFYEEYNYCVYYL